MWFLQVSRRVGSVCKVNLYEPSHTTASLSYTSSISWVDRTGSTWRLLHQVTKCESNASGHTLSATERGTNWCVFQRGVAVACVVTWRVHSVATQNEDEIRTVRRLGCIGKNVTRNSKNNYSVWWLKITCLCPFQYISLKVTELAMILSFRKEQHHITIYIHIFKY